MATIRANRESINDRNSVLGFTVRAPLFEIGLATDPELLKAEHRARRTPQNFFTSRVLRAAPSQRGEAVYLVPPDVVSRFVGQERLYFGLATYREQDPSRPEAVQIPDRGRMYVSLSGLTERGFRRSLRGRSGGTYGNGGEMLGWGGDLAGPLAGNASGNGAGNGAATHNGSASGNGGGSDGGAATYSDGYSDDLWRQPEPAVAPAPTPAAMPAPSAEAQSLRPGTVRALSPISSDYHPGSLVDALRAQAGFFLDSARWFVGVSDTRVMPHAAICQVRLNDDAETGQGTAFYIAPGLLLTAAHVVAGQTELIVIPGKNGAGSGSAREPFGRFVCTQFATYPGYSGSGDTNRDMALIRVPQGHAAPAGRYFDLVEELLESRPEGVVVTGYAMQSHGSGVVDRVINATIDQDKQHMMGGYIRTLPTDHTFTYNIQTLGGTSGSPVYWIEDTGGGAQAHVVGVHVSGFDDHSNRGCRINREKLEWIRRTAAGWGQTLSFAQRAHALGLAVASEPARASARALEIITPFYDPADPSSALTCQNDAFSLAREEWFVGVQNTRLFPHSAICLLEMDDGGGAGSGGFGTGFYIGRNRILTCAHNLHGMRRVTVIPGKNGEGAGSAQEPYGRFTVAAASWRVAPRYTGDGDWDNDLAVIDNVPTAAPGGQWFEFLNATPSDRMPLVVCGYSRKSRAVPQLSALMDGTKQHLHGGYARRQPTPETIDYPILTLARASGSPVYTLEDDGDGLRAKICAVHVSGEPAAEGLNRGCFITPAKIDWIEGRATSFALADASEARAERDARTLRRLRGALAGDAPVRGQSASSQAQGLFDLLPVELKLRVFIPSPAILMSMPILSDRAFSGDGRGFQRSGGTSRAEIHTRLHFGSGDTRARLETITPPHWGESKEYRVDDTSAVSGRPGWYRNVNPGAQPIDRATLARTEGNLSVSLGGSSFNGIISVAEGSVVVGFHVAGNLPLVTGSPDIDANLYVHVRINGDRVQARVVGGHDEFPAYELYANDQRIYSYNPLDHGGTPFGLVGDGNWDVEVDTNYVDCGPASEYRIIGPVRIGTAQGLDFRGAVQPLSGAQSIPLDPGLGGQSIGESALQPGDIIVSTARHAVSYAIRAGTISAISHAMLYVGDGNVIEAVGDGVREVALGTAIAGAILAVAYRDARVDATKAAAIVGYARAQVGRPYDYAGVARAGHRILFPLAGRVLDAVAGLAGVGSDSARAFYCSELVFAAYREAGVPLTASAPDTSTPDDLVQLSRANLGYVGHLIAHESLFGVALSLGAASAGAATHGRAQAVALGGDGPSDFDVQLIPQPDKNACWAASMAMLIGYRGQMSITPEAIVNAVGGSLNTSYGWDLLTRVRDLYGFRMIAQPSNASTYHSPRQWAQWLNTYGPLWVVIVGAPHAVVISGIRGDLDDPAQTEVHILNPWDTRVSFSNHPIDFVPANRGYADWLPFLEFAQDFGDMAQADYGNWRILHLPANAAHAQSLGDDATTAVHQGPSVQGDEAAAAQNSRLHLPEDIEPGAPPSTALAAAAVGVEIASAIAGAAMDRIANNSGDIGWELDQLRGFKHPNDTAPNPMPPAANGRRIVLRGPSVENGFGDEISATFEIDWQYNGRSVGNVLIGNAGTNDAIGWGLTVRARIMDDNIVYPPENPTYAALLIRVEHHFSRFIGSDKIAITEIRLFGNGTYSRRTRVVQD